MLKGNHPESFDQKKDSKRENIMKALTKIRCLKGNHPEGLNKEKDGKENSFVFVKAFVDVGST